MKLSSVKELESTQRIPLSVDGEDCYIEVCSINSRRYAAGMSWFKRASAEKAMSGIELIKTESVLGEEIPIQSEEYKRLESILMAHLVVDWGFDDELTLNSAAEFLMMRPDIKTAIDEASSMMAYAEATAKKPQ